MRNSRFASREPVHRNTHRAFFHDYTRPGRYMITITRVAGAPPLAVFDFQRRVLSLTPLGKDVRDAMLGIHERQPYIWIIGSVIMPDHIHFTAAVTHTMPKPLGAYIGGFKGACSKRWALLWGHNEVKSLFCRGFNDRIIWDDAHMVAATRYIADNPRRAAVKAANPDLFQRFNHISIAGRELAAYGNIFLLHDYDIRAVIIHRADTEEVRSSKVDEWLACADNGGVLVSPFISKAEKEVRNRAIEMGGRVIVLRNEGFEERFKPAGREFDLCAEGRLLLLAPWPDKLRRTVVSRSQALSMNALAEAIAASAGASVMA